MRMKLKDHIRVNKKNKQLDIQSKENVRVFLEMQECPIKAIKHMLSIGWTLPTIVDYWPNTPVKNSAGVRFKAKPVVGAMSTTLNAEPPAGWNCGSLSSPKGGKIKYPIDSKAKITPREEEECQTIMNGFTYDNKSFFSAYDRVNQPVEEIELSDIGLDRLIEDITAIDFATLRAKAHAKEVAQAEKVEKYKRELLNSREARFYAVFRELGATHEEAVKHAWGDS